MKSNSTTRLTVGKSYDNLFRLTVISNIPSADSVMTFAYAYNSANQRTAVTNADGSVWRYGYDSLGQVTSGKRSWGDGVPVSGQQFEYAYDDIGNRKYAAEGGNEFGTGLRYQTYSANSLNQYTQRTVPGAVDVIGGANSNATVTVNLQSTDRHNDYFHAAYHFDNSSAAKYQGLTNVGVLANGTNADIVTTNTGFALLPQTPEVYSYDLDGNLKTNGLWVLTWDAENRLVAIDLAYSFSVLPDAAKRNLRFSYDSLGRRISKTVSNYSGANWHLEYSTKFIYDGWNLLAEINATNNSILRTYMWGIDASGTLHGAGGIGGLLAMRDSSGSVTTNYFYGYDGNHNTRTLVSARDGQIAAEYEYEPFGEVIRASGFAASLNDFWFSTKRRDRETDFLNYGYRYLNTGRWLTRDAIGEQGGWNVYVFVGNDPQDNIDLLGLLAASVESIQYSGHGSTEFNGTAWQYIVLDDRMKGVPLDVSATRNAASISAKLDDGFNAKISAWTSLTGEVGLDQLSMSTSLNGTIKVCCSCPFKKVRAGWSAMAALTGTAGNAHAQFDAEPSANTAWNRPSASQSGTTDKTLSSSSYCTTFGFVLGQGWVDVSKRTPTTSIVRITATFECIE